MTQPTNAQLAAQITALLAKWNAREAEFRDWLAGVPDGGPNNDGRYPLTNASGESFLVDCPAKMADDVDGPAALARTAQLLAEQARDTAEGFRDSARDDAELATGAKVDALAARDLAKVYRDDAASHAANLQVARDAAASSAESAQLARDESVAARDEAVYAKGATLVARAEAVQARDQAEAFAAAINPATLATKSDLSAEIARIVGQSPETLNALDELAAALGNDPNFATTITSQIAQKAALVHSHGIADILGLQTSLDGKQPVGNYALVGHSHGWDQITGKPSTFAPSTHRHSWGELDGVPSSFTPSAHGHSITEVSGLQAALDAKQPAGSYLPTTGGTLTGTLTINDSYLGVLVLKGQGSGQTEYQVRQGIIGGSVGGFSIYEVATGQNRIAIRPDGVVFINGRDVLGEMDGKAWLYIPDTRTANWAPTDLTGHNVRFDFKTAAVVGNPPVTASKQPTYAHIMSITGWNGYEPSGGLPAQVSFGDGLAVRAATSPTAWGPWRNVWHDGNLPSPLRMGEGGRPFSYDNGGGAAYIQGDAGGWSIGYKIKDSSGANRGGFGALGSGTTLTHYWIGADYDAPGALRVYPNGDVKAGGTITGQYLAASGITIGAQNTSWLHFMGDGRPFYFSHAVYVDGPIVRYGKGAVLHHADPTLSSGQIFVSATQPSGMVAGDLWLKPL